MHIKRANIPCSRRFRMKFWKRNGKIVGQSVNRVNTDAERAALLKVAEDTAAAESKASVLRKLGVGQEETRSNLSLADIAVFKARKSTYDADGNGNISQQEAAANLRDMDGLTDKDRARLWQYSNSAWSADKNPFIPQRIKSAATRKAARDNAAKKAVEKQKQEAILRYALEFDW